MLIVKNAVGEAFDLDANTPLTDTLREITVKDGMNTETALQHLWGYLNGASPPTSAFAKAAASIVAKLATSNAELSAILDSHPGAFLLDQHASTSLPVARKLRDAPSPLSYELTATRSVKTQTGDATLAAKADADLSASIKVPTISQTELKPPLEIGAYDTFLRERLAQRAKNIWETTRQT